MKKYITIQQSNKIINYYNKLRQKGLRPIIKKNYFKIGCGCFIIGVSLITPFTNMFLIPVGLFILGINIRTLEEYKRKSKTRFKQWLYKKRGS